jgi:hypothetical protein
MSTEASDADKAARSGSGAPAGTGNGDGKDQLSYQGIQVPWFLVVAWIVFLVWGVIYLLRFVPPSVREWFLQK